jgi:hypothetical protein
MKLPPYAQRYVEVMKRETSISMRAMLAMIAIVLLTPPVAQLFIA